MRKYYGIKAPKEEKPITEEDLKNIKKYMKEVKDLVEEESVLTDEQMQEYLKKYPQLDEVDIMFTADLCSTSGANVDKAIAELAQEAIKIYEQQKYR